MQNKHPFPDPGPTLISSHAAFLFFFFYHKFNFNVFYGCKTLTTVFCRSENIRKIDAVGYASAIFLYLSILVASWYSYSVFCPLRFALLKVFSKLKVIYFDINEEVI